MSNLAHDLMNRLRSLWKTTTLTPPTLLANHYRSTLNGITIYASYRSPCNTSGIRRPPPNAWYMVCHFSSLDIRFELEPSPSGTSTIAALTIEGAAPGTPFGSDTESDGPEISVELPVARSITFFEVLQVILQNGLHQYRFASDGRGQRHWMRAMVFHFQDAGILYPDSLAQLFEILPYRWAHGRATPWPLTVGTFFTCYGCETRRTTACDHGPPIAWALEGMRRRRLAGI